MLAELIELKTNKSEKGSLTFFESNRDIDFDIKRIYFTYDVSKGEKRGMHAHKNLNQILFCPYGEVTVVVTDGVNEETYVLDNPSKGLIIRSGIWRDLYFVRENSVLCVGASNYYTEDDYIRDYDEFIKYVESGYWK